MDIVKDLMVYALLPVITAVISGMIVYHFENYKKNPFSKIARKKETLDILEQYCRNKDVEPIISYSDPDALKITTTIKQGKILLRGDVNLKNQPRNKDNRNFVMALIKYIPDYDWSSFVRKNYTLMLNVNVSDHIKGMQLEIKDDKLQKVIDQFIPIAEKTTTFKYELSRVGDSTTLERISEICFTIFCEEKYIDSIDGCFEVSEFSLIPMN